MRPSRLVHEKDGFTAESMVGMNGGDEMGCISKRMSLINKREAFVTRSQKAAREDARRGNRHRKDPPHHQKARKLNQTTEDRNSVFIINSEALIYPNFLTSQDRRVIRA